MYTWYLIESGHYGYHEWCCEWRGAHDLADLEDHARVIDAARMVRSWDHGLQTFDEYAASVAAEILAYVGDAFAAMAGAPTCIPFTDAWAMICDEYDYSGDGWAEPTDDDPGAERMYWLWEDVERWASDVGLIVESCGDAGMTWLLVPMHGEKRERAMVASGLEHDDAA